MDWVTYKALCDRPDYWSRWMLEQCVALFEQQQECELARHLRDALAEAALTRPDDHNGPPQTHMFKLSLSTEQRRAALTTVQRAAADGVHTPGTARRGLGGFTEAWQEYARFQVPQDD